MHMNFIARDDRLHVLNLIIGFFLSFTCFATTEPNRSLAVGTRNGFSLYSLNSIDSSLEEIYSSSGEEISIVERLFSSSLVAVVSLNAPRKLKVSH